MGWFSDFFSGGSSTPSGGGYEEAAYGGQRDENWTVGGLYGGDGGYTPPPAVATPVVTPKSAYEQYADALRDQGVANLSGAGSASEQQYQDFGNLYGDDFKQENLRVLGDYATGDFAGGDFTNQLVYDIPEDFGAMATNFLGPRIIGTGLGSVVGSASFGATANPQLAGGLATGVDLVTKGILSQSKIADTVQLADGTVGYLTNFAGKQGFTTKDAVTERNITAALEAQQQSDSDSGDVAQSMGTGLSIASSTGGGSPSWRDYYSGGFTFDPEDFAKQMIGGQLGQSDLKAVQLAGRLATGEDLVPAVFGVYGEDIKEVLPEGYENPTEAAVRIGLGENRVDVLGDVYGTEFNLDNPMGKAGLEGAAVFDKTGDADAALQKSVYTYFKEGGKLTDFEVPDFLPDANLDFDLKRLTGMDIDLPDAIKFIGGIDFGSLKADFPDVNLPDLKVAIPDIDFTGVKASELGITLPEAKELGIDIPSLDIDVDFGAIGSGLAYQAGGGGKGVVVDSNDEFQSLDSPFELAQDDESLARDLIAGRI